MTFIAWPDQKIDCTAWRVVNHPTIVAHHSQFGVLPLDISSMYSTTVCYFLVLSLAYVGIAARSPSTNFIVLSGAVVKAFGAIA